jgi:hypothetical protein
MGDEPARSGGGGYRALRRQHASPVAVYHDVDPFLAGKAVLYHEDPFGSSLTTPADSSGTFFEYFQVDRRADPFPVDPPVLHAIDLRPGGGARVEFTATPATRYRVEASSDLVEWVTIPGPHVVDAVGRLTVEDNQAGERRFWRLAKLD